MADKRLSGPVLGAFSGPTVVVGALGIPLGVYLPTYYASDLGIDLAASGLALAFVQFIAIAFDPLVGYGLDATRTRWGRFRPWMLASAPILMLSTAGAFMARPGVSVLYLILCLLPLYFGLSMSMMATNAWGAALAPEYHARSRLYAWVQVLGYGGALVCLLLPKLLETFGDTDEVSVVHGMGWFVIAVAPLTAVLAVALVGEPAKPDTAWQRIGAREYVALARRPAMLRLLASNLLLTSAPSLTGALYFIFFTEARGYSFSEATTLLFIYIAAGLLMPLWARIARAVGKHRAVMIAALVNALGQCALIVLPVHVFWPMAVMMFVVGFAANSYALLLNAMVADVSDEVRLESGNDRTAPLFALMIVFAKIGGLIPLAVVFPLLSFVGFNPAHDAVNTPEALRNLEACFVFAPVLAIAAGGLSLLGYHLNAERHGEIRKRLDESDAALLIASALANEGIMSPATHIPVPIDLDAPS